MKAIFRTYVICVIICLFGSSLTFATNIERIVISSEWTGWGSKKSSLTITYNQNGFYNNNGEMINEEKIDRLLEVIDEPVIDKLDISNLGIDQNWLNNNAQIALQKQIRAEWEIDHKALFLKTFKDIKTVQKVLQKYYGYFWTDDYPEISVEIFRKDGNYFKIFSISQQAYMLPWFITFNGQTVRTYNSNISRAIVDILPEKFVNKEKIAGEKILNIVSDEVYREIRNEFDRFKNINND